jgi:hypothetical protein
MEGGVDMAKINTPFLKVECPICGVLVDRKLNETALAQHLQDKHSDKPKKPVPRALLYELKQSIPSNIEGLNDDELNAAIENMCQHRATKKGLKRMKGGL